MKVCYIGNLALHYRKRIFELIDQTYECDWVFGKSLSDIKEMDTNILKGRVEKTDVINFFGGKIIWQKGMLKYLNKDYTHYLLLGEERNITTWLFLFFSKMYPKKKVFLWTHGMYGKEGRLKVFIETLFHKMSDGGFIYNNYSRNLMINRGLNPEKLFTIHNSLDYDRQVELRKSNLISDVYKKHFRNNYPTLIFIGRLTKVKKLDQLIEAIDILKRCDHIYNLVFVGDGTERDALKELVREKKIEVQVWFYGACYEERLNAELIYNADLCVAPGNVGLTAMHTMVFGTPVISHNNFPWQMPEFEAIQPGLTGDFFEMDNVESLVETINKWFDTAKDRETVRQACYKEIDTQWTPQFQIEVLKKHLK